MFERVPVQSLTHSSQLHPNRSSPSHLGQSPAGFGERTVRRKPVEHPFCAHASGPRRHCLDSIRYWSFRQSGNLLHLDVPFCRTKDTASVCQVIRLAQHHWRDYGDRASLYSAVVREHVRPRTRPLWHARVSGRPGTNRQALRSRYVHHEFLNCARALWCFPQSARWRRDDRGLVHDLLLPAIQGILHLLRRLAVVGDHVSEPPLRRGLGGR